MSTAASKRQHTWKSVHTRATHCYRTRPLCPRESTKCKRVLRTGMGPPLTTTENQQPLLRTLCGITSRTLPIGYASVTLWSATNDTNRVCVCSSLHAYVLNYPFAAGGDGDSPCSNRNDTWCNSRRTGPRRIHYVIVFHIYKCSPLTNHCSEWRNWQCRIMAQPGAPVQHLKTPLLTAVRHL